MADDAIGLVHHLHHILEGHELDPGRVRHLGSWGRAAMLDDEVFAAERQRLDQVERSGEGLLMGAEAKQDQRRFQNNERA